jgi:hypothetical protein
MRFAACLLVAFACSGAFASEPGPQALTFEDRLRAQVQIDAVSTDANVKVTLCHIPPGNPANAQTITVGQAAVAAHLAHGDYLGECHTACSGVLAPVPKTGQTGCSDVNGTAIDCAGTGQDGEFQKGVTVSPRFTDNADGTVTDNLTGLIWLKNTSCFGAQSWTTALSDATTLASGACGLTDGSAVGDWRMPNIKELQSLIDYGQGALMLPVGHPFSGVQSAVYWSSTTHVGFLQIAWVVHLGGGFVNGANKVNAFYAWPVRGGQ